MQMSSTGRPRPKRKVRGSRRCSVGADICIPYDAGKESTVPGDKARRAENIRGTWTDMCMHGQIEGQVRDVEVDVCRVVTREQRNPMEPVVTRGQQIKWNRSSKSACIDYFSYSPRYSLPKARHECKHGERDRRARESRQIPQEERKKGHENERLGSRWL